MSDCASPLHTLPLCFCKSHLFRNRPISQIPRCIGRIYHSAAHVNRNVQISATKWCLVVYRTGAIWDLDNGCITGSSHLFVDSCIGANCRHKYFTVQIMLREKFTHRITLYEKNRAKEQTPELVPFAHCDTANQIAGIPKTPTVYTCARLTNVNSNSKSNEML